MKIEYIATGEELLDGRTQNKNGLYLGNTLYKLGLTLNRITTIGDNLHQLISTIQERWQQCDTLIISGGLGPTDDDRTRDAISQALHLPLEFREEAMHYIKRYFTSQNRTMNPQNKIQAYTPQSANLLVSGYGTAPGFTIQKNNKTLYALPGVTKEFIMMFEADILPYLQQTTLPKFHVKRWTIYGIGESNCQALFTDFYPLPKHLDIGFKASLNGTQIQLKNNGKKNDSTAQKLALLIQDKIRPYTLQSSETTLAQTISDQLKTKKQTLSLAESCTGGLLAKTLTDLPGSSQFFIESAVTYQNKQKEHRLNVSPKTLQTYGAVSKETAEEMSIGSQQTTNSDIAIATTGIAGPNGGTPDKPIGTIWIALSSKQKTVTKKLNLTGTRTQIRQKTVCETLWFLHQHLNNV